MYDLNQEQRMLVDSIERIAEEEFAESAFEWQGEMPWENARTLAREGFLGINFDEEYGGGGMTEFEAMLVVEAVGRVCPDTASYLVNQQFLGPRTIEMFGTEAAKEKYLPPVIEAEDYVVVAISEPEAGSDVQSMNTEVRREDGEYVLSGEKIWVSCAVDSSTAVVWTKFPDGMGTVILDLDDPGVEMAEHFTNMAGEKQSQFYIDDVVIPEENLLTHGDDGFKDQLKALNWERLGSAVFSNSLALCSLEKALDYAQQREQFGQPIGDFQGIEWKLAELVTDLQQSRTYTYQAGRYAVENGRIPDPMKTSIAKYKASMLAEEVASESLQVHGANGYQQGHPLEYLYRFARGRRIAGGTTEIQKNLIARQLKKNGVPTVH